MLDKVKQHTVIATQEVEARSDEISLGYVLYTCGRAWIRGLRISLPTTLWCEREQFMMLLLVSLGGGGDHHHGGGGGSGHDGVVGGDDGGDRGGVPGT